MTRDHTLRRTARGATPLPWIVQRMREALACLTGVGLALAAVTYEYCIALRVARPLAPGARLATSGGEAVEAPSTHDATWEE
jgi:hypothetical protein